MPYEASGKYIVNFPGEVELGSRLSLGKRLFPTGNKFSGELNTNYIYYCQNKQSIERFVLRVPKQEESRINTVQSIETEYRGIGATNLGVGFRLRSLFEQAEFIENLKRKGFRTVDYLDVDAKAMLLPYIEGVSLSEHLKQIKNRSQFTVVEDVLTQLNSIHRQGQTIGDRWCPNTMVLPENIFLELDYDLELQGSHSIISTFEIAQILYHIIHFAAGSRGVVLTYLTEFLEKHPDFLKEYDTDNLTYLLAGHAEYFLNKGAKYIDIVPPYHAIYALMEKLK